MSAVLPELHYALFAIISYVNRLVKCAEGGASCRYLRFRHIQVHSHQLFGE